MDKFKMAGVYLTEYFTELTIKTITNGRYSLDTTMSPYKNNNITMLAHAQYHAHVY